LFFDFTPKALSFVVPGSVTLRGFSDYINSPAKGTVQHLNHWSEPELDHPEPNHGSGSGFRYYPEPEPWSGSGFRKNSPNQTEPNFLSTSTRAGAMH
jgi:hypothetical protein